MNLTNKLKIGVSCFHDNHTRDIDLMNTPKGLTIFVGGEGGTIPRLGGRLVMNVPNDKVLDLVDEVIKIYNKNAIEKE